MTTFRCVTDTNGKVICIGKDRGQGGTDYPETGEKMGVWEDFTFTTIPEVPAETLTWITANDWQGNCHKVVDNEIVVKTLEEIQND